MMQKPRELKIIRL